MPNVHLVSFSQKQQWPNKDAYWSPATPRIGMPEKGLVDMVPKPLLQELGRTFGRLPMGTRNSLHRSSSQLSVFMLNSYVRDAFVTSVT